MEYLKSLGTILFVFVVFIAVLYLAYKTTRFLGKRYNPVESAAKNIKVLDKVLLSQGQSLVVAQVAGKYLLLGCTEHSIQTLCELPQENLNIIANTDTPPLNFAQIFEKVKQSTHKEGRKDNDENS